MKNNDFLPLARERANTWTHLFGTAFALSSIWLVWPSAQMGWQMALGVAFFVLGMFLMFLSSTLYHWAPEGAVKQALRKCDHISIYVMIACSYSPICIGVVGGWIGWTAFAVQWVLVLSGTVYKLLAMGRWPRLSLALYLAMGWSVLLIMGPVVRALTPLSICLLVAEGLFYTVGTYFFAHDERPFFHAIWHIFVLLGAMAHWAVVLTIVLGHNS
ncbi:MAG: hemolysin III family protein [Bacteroidaceae bacterium]|nr:hemolysin III family protein [Bacteroidaceae bacterium]